MTLFMKRTLSRPHIPNPIILYFFFKNKSLVSFSFIFSNDSFYWIRKAIFIVKKQDIGINYLSIFHLDNLITLFNR